MVVLKSGITDTGTTEYYLVGLEMYDDIELVLDQLTQMDANILELLDGIWFRIATVEMGNITFKVVWHEDVGVYSYVPGEPSETADRALQRILEKVILHLTVRKECELFSVIGVISLFRSKPREKLINLSSG